MWSSVIAGAVFRTLSFCRELPVMLQIPLDCALRTYLQNVVLNRIRLRRDLGSVAVRLPLMFGPSPVRWFAHALNGNQFAEKKVPVRKVLNGPRRGMRSSRFNRFIPGYCRNRLIHLVYPPDLPKGSPLPFMSTLCFG